jgi:hypothetical protein
MPVSANVSVALVPLQILVVPDKLAVGKLLLVITTSPKVLQLPLVIVHLNVALLPAASPVTVLVGEVSEFIVTEPLTMLQAPVPVVAGLAFSVKFPSLH